MKKLLRVLLMMILIVLFVTACGENSNKVSDNNEVKDVTMLLSGIGGELSTIESLGKLPEPEVDGQIRNYITKDTEGYFSGFNLGIGLADDGKTVTLVYVQPYDGNQIKVNGFIIGCDITEMKALFGEGELTSSEENGKILTYMTYRDENYNIKCTVDENIVTAVSFTKLNDDNEKADAPNKELNSEKAVGYDVKVANEGLILHDYQTGKEKNLMQSDGEIDKVYNVAYLPDSNMIYFDTNPSPTRQTNGAGANNHELYSYNLKASAVTHITSFNLEDIIDEGPYSGNLVCSSYYSGADGLTKSYLIVDDKGEVIVNLEDSYDIDRITAQIEEALPPSLLSWLDGETINGQTIEAGRLSAVVIEEYDGQYANNLESILCINAAYKNGSNYYDIYVFGVISNVKLLSSSSMGSGYVETDIADQIRDKRVRIESSFPTDFSHDKFTFYDASGNYHEMVIDDMSDDYDIVLCK